MSEPSEAQKAARDLAPSSRAGYGVHYEAQELERYEKCIQQAIDAAIARLRRALAIRQRRIGELEANTSKLREQLEQQSKTLDWAETLLCNVVPMPHCTQEEWDATLRKWRDEKHGVAKQ